VSAHRAVRLKTRFEIVFVCVGVALVAACRTPGPPAPPPPDLDPALLVAAFEQEAASRHGLRARARISIEAPDVKLSRPQRIAVQRPDSLRVEILGLFSQVAAVLAVKDGLYQLWESGEREIQHGPVTPSLLWRVARVALTPEEAVDLLLGTPRLAPGAATFAARWNGARFEVDRSLRGRRPLERLGFDADGRLRRFERFDGAGALVWSATFDDHRPLTGGDGAMRSFAHSVRLRFPAEQAEVEVDYKDVQLDPELAPALFELPGRRRAALR